MVVLTIWSRMGRPNLLAVGGPKLEVWKVTGTEATLLGWPCCRLVQTGDLAKKCLQEEKKYDAWKSGER